MTPTGLSVDGSIKYEMTGMFAEILDNLQVSLINHSLVIDFGSSKLSKESNGKNTTTDFIEICGIISFLKLIALFDSYFSG